jgi:CubicO group peptidase (beta-lactamase class C family)
MRRSIQTIFVSFVLASAAIRTACRADPVDDYIHIEMSKRHIPGLALAVVLNGNSVKLQGYGVANLEQQSPVTPNTVFELASITKQFTAAGIMLLVQDGRLSVDDPLGKFVKSLPGEMSGITLRQLMSHTSGLPREGPNGVGKTYRDDITEDEIWRTATRIRPESAPGAKFIYSNVGFNLLGLVIERVSGKTYAEFMRSRIFGPLGMASTQVNDLRTIIANRASGYFWENGAYKNGMPTSPTTYLSSSSIVSTAADLVKWDAALSSNGLLAAKYRSMMWTPSELSNGKTVNYGYGWAIGDNRGHHYVCHDGMQLSGFRSFIVRYTDDHLTIILLTNESDLDDPGRIARHVAQEYIPSFKVPQPPLVTGNPAMFPLFTGRYEYANNKMLTVTIENGQIAASLPDNTCDIYKPTSDTGFYSADVDIQLTFVTNSAGRVVAVNIKQDGVEKIAPRIGAPVHARVPQPDPDSALTARILDALDALAVGGKQLAKVPGVTRGVRRDFISVHQFADLRSLTYISSDDVSDRKIERHGGKVARIITYKFVTNTITRYVLIYLTADNLMTDYDIVAD